MIKEMGKKKKKGFSLVELIVVIAIIGILAAIAVPKYSAYKDSANKKADEVTAKLIAEATLMASESDGLSTKADFTSQTKDSWKKIEKFISNDVESKSLSGELNTDYIWDIEFTVEKSNSIIKVVLKTLTKDVNNKDVIESAGIEFKLEY